MAIINSAVSNPFDLSGKSGSGGGGVVANAIEDNPNAGGVATTPAKPGVTTTTLGTVTDGVSGTGGSDYGVDPYYLQNNVAKPATAAGGAAATPGAVSGGDLHSQLYTQMAKDGVSDKDINAGYVTGLASKLGVSTGDIATALGMSPSQAAAWMSSHGGGTTPANTGTTTPTGTTGGVVASAQAAQTATSTYNPALVNNPTPWNVTQDQTAAGQMQKYLDPTNPLNQAWKTQGLMTANERGLVNSSIGASLATDSIARNATPLAQQDASTYAKAASYNADMPNQFAIANQNATNTAGQSNAGQTNNMTQAQLQSSTALQTTAMNNAASLANTALSTDAQKYVAGLNSDTQMAVTKLNNANQVAISTMENRDRAILQHSSEATNAFQSFIQSVSTIQNNQYMDEAAKATAIQNAQLAYNQAVAGIRKATGVTDIPDVSTSLTFGP